VAAEPRIHILFEFVDGPWGGGNQFLKALWGQITARGVAAATPEQADVVLANSHHELPRLVKLRRRHPEKAVVHRVDGPIHLIRDRDREVDEVLYRVNHALADGTVFQSRWSREANLAAGMAPPGKTTVILNAPDPALFHTGEEPRTRGERLRLIATSWSPNPRKGFDCYSWLDANLDFERYELTFIGNSPVEFRNVRVIAPLPSAELAEELRRHDVFITGSRADPCSNSLLEALHCGLPALARHDGGHPELIGAGGETFREFPEALEKLDAIADGYERYRDAIDVPSMDEVADRYLSFMADVHEARSAGPSSAGVRSGRGLLGARAMATALKYPLSKRLLAAGLSATRRR
jgi:glycosyltransferase involved in cell wall biosynthesis